MNYEHMSAAQYLSYRHVSDALPLQKMIIKPSKRVLQWYLT